MGLDLLDLTFRLEKAFQIKLPKGSLIEEVWDRDRRDLQAGKIHKQLCKMLEEQGRSVPFSSWHRVKVCIAGAVGVSPLRVKLDSWLIKELGCS